MWNRTCPLCFVKLPRILVLTRGDELVCPSCLAPLELSRASRVMSAVAGLLFACLAAQASLDISPIWRWVVPVLTAVLGYGIGAALVLYLLSDLVVRPKPGVGHFPQSHK
jgi:hypothetical protein